MYNFRNLVALALFACLSVVTTGCNTDCDTYCRNQGNFIDGCLPQFDQTWADLGEGEWSKKSDFIGFCKDEIEAYIVDDIEAAQTAKRLVLQGRSRPRTVKSFTGPKSCTPVPKPAHLDTETTVAEI